MLNRLEVQLELAGSERQLLLSRQAQALAAAQRLQPRERRQREVPARLALLAEEAAVRQVQAQLRLALVALAATVAFLSSSTVNAQGSSSGASTVSPIEIPLRVIDQSNNLVCNLAGSYVPIPGYPGYYLGRVLGTPNPVYCAGVNSPVANYATLGIYQLSVASRTLTLLYSLATPPTTINGNYFRTIYDPSVTSYNGQLWVAAECTIHIPANAGGTEFVSACVFQLSVDGMGTFSINSSTFNAPVLGTVSEGIIQSSVSIPQIVNWSGTPYLYWTSDNHGISPVISYGAQLTSDLSGLLWTVDGAGAAVNATAETVVYDVVANDPLYGWVASIRSLYQAADGSGFYAVSSLGGTSPSNCTSPVSASSGCFRAGVTFSATPIGYNVFAGGLKPTDQIPINPLSYPKSLTDPVAGTRYLAAGVLNMVDPLNVGYGPAYFAVNTALLSWPTDIP